VTRMMMLRRRLLVAGVLVDEEALRSNPHSVHFGCIAKAFTNGLEDMIYG
jgi:hypothetical protein